MCSIGTDQVFDWWHWSRWSDFCTFFKLQNVMGIEFSLRTWSLAPVSKAGWNRQRLEMGRQTEETNANSYSLLKLISCESMMPSNHLILCHFPFLLPSIFPNIRVFSNELVLCIRWPKYFEFQLQPQSFQRRFRTDFLQDGLVVSPCSPRDSQASSPTPQFKSSSSLAFSFLYSPTLTSIYDYWKTIALTL